MKFTLSLLSLFIGFSMTGCLKTRSQLRQEADGGRDLGRQTQEQIAPPEDMNETLREMRGRVDALESQILELKRTHQEEMNQEQVQKAEAEQRLKAYEEALKGLEAQLQASRTAPTTPSKSAGSSKAGTDSFKEGEELFEDKKWKEAIVAFQKYRDGQPKGRMYAEATYKIGVCFQELKMKDAAKAFFEEVTAKFPKSKEAKKSAFRLKTIK